MNMNSILQVNNAANPQGSGLITSDSIDAALTQVSYPSALVTPSHSTHLPDGEFPLDGLPYVSVRIANSSGSQPDSSSTPRGFFTVTSVFLGFGSMYKYKLGRYFSE